MTHATPRTLTEAFTALDAPGASVIAGGTDWFPARGEGAIGRALVDVTRLPGFDGITQAEGGGWRIGAATRWADLAAAALPPALDGLRASARVVGAVQVQNAGTIGGNLCNASPAADGVPPLLTLDARVELVSRAGRREMALATFLRGPRQTALAPGEILSAVFIPDPGPHWHGSFAKAGTRAYLVISVAMVALLCRVQGGRVAAARVAVGACSPVARRLPALEQALAGHPQGRPLAVTPAHLAALTPIDDVRGSAAYRLQAVAALISDLLEAT